MSEIKYDTGEWIIMQDTGLRFKNITNYINSGPRTLAIIYGATPEEAAGNAVIMAASKDLLEACKVGLQEIQAAYKLMGINNPERGRLKNGPVKLLEAAIAKATSIKP